MPHQHLQWQSALGTPLLTHSSKYEIRDKPDCRNLEHQAESISYR
jgi:hypothetical protein